MHLFTTDRISIGSCSTHPSWGHICLKDCWCAATTSVVPALKKTKIVVVEGATVLVLFVYLLKQYKASTGRAFVYGTNQRTHVDVLQVLPNRVLDFYIIHSYNNLDIKVPLYRLFDCYGLFFEFLGDKTAIKLDLDFYLHLLMCSN